jgi:tRNA uridine 5-carboxymethylaminomethyl modification enzyme
MLTSRSEYRLLLRQDNADARLTAIGRQLGLISDERWEMFHVKQSQIEQESRRVVSITIPPSPALNKLLEERGTAPVETGVKLVDLLRRPQLDYDMLAPFDPGRPELSHEVTEQVGLAIKYDGYIKKQLAQVEQMRRLEGMALPGELDYTGVKGLRLEAQEKLNRVRPASVGQASRISGVNPADISVLLIWLERKRREGSHE